MTHPTRGGVTGYNADKEFNHEEFWEWCREQSRDNIVLISEQVAPDDFRVIWESGGRAKCMSW